MLDRSPTLRTALISEDAEVEGLDIDNLEKLLQMLVSEMHFLNLNFS